MCRFSLLSEEFSRNQFKCISTWQRRWRAEKLLQLVFPTHHLKTFVFVCVDTQFCFSFVSLLDKFSFYRTFLFFILFSKFFCFLTLFRWNFWEIKIKYFVIHCWYSIFSFIFFIEALKFGGSWFVYVCIYQRTMFLYDVTCWGASKSIQTSRQLLTTNRLSGNLLQPLLVLVRHNLLNGNKKR